MPQPRKTMRGIIDANKAIGHHWFDKGAMAFFNTVIRSGVTVCAEASYFFVSHQYLHPSDASQDGPMFYTIQRANIDGSIDTIGKDAVAGGYPDGKAAHDDFHRARYEAIQANKAKATA